MVAGRRHTDATRAELPVVRPDTLVDSFDDWIKQFSRSDGEVATPLCLNNGEGVTLEHIQYFAGCLAAAAQDLAWFINQPTERREAVLQY